jgi:ribulose-phosphate 3-epimerase
MGENIIVSPSIASADPLRLAEELKRVHRHGCTDLHIDIEDGNFVPNITFGKKTVSALRSVTCLPFSFHLMTRHWKDWVTFAAGHNTSIVFVHFETLDYPREFVFFSKSLNLRCGLAFNPKTPVDGARYLFDDLDGILLLGTEPDNAGGSFLPIVLDKAKWLHGRSQKMEIWVDGAVNFERLNELRRNGVTHAVMGRAFFFSCGKK